MVNVSEVSFDDESEAVVLPESVVDAAALESEDDEDGDGVGFDLEALLDCDVATDELFVSL